MFHLHRRIPSYFSLLALSILVLTSLAFSLPSSSDTRRGLSRSNDFIHYVLSTLSHEKSTPTFDPPKQNVALGRDSLNSYHFLPDSTASQIVGIPQTDAHQFQTPHVFPRLTRGSIDRMPAHFGKRSYLEVEPTLWDNSAVESQLPRHQINSLIERLARFNDDDDVIAKMAPYLWSKERQKVGQMMKKSPEYTDDTWSRVKPAGRFGVYDESSGQDFPQWVHRISTFGKRGNPVKRMVSYRRLSDMISRLDPRSPAYKNIINRLQRMGITFSRGSRSRLSRMPQLYGKKKRSFDDYRVVPGDAGSYYGVDFPIIYDYSNLKTDKSLSRSARNRGFKGDNFDYSSLDHESEFGSEDKQNRVDDFRKTGLSWPDEAKYLVDGSMRLSGKDGGKRSSLSRMPLAFGKKSSPQVDPYLEMIDTNPLLRPRYYAHGDAMNVKRKSEDFQLKPTGDIKETPVYSKVVPQDRHVLSSAADDEEVDDGFDDKGVSEHVEGSRNSVFQNVDDSASQENVGFSRRSSLRRMPMHFGKRQRMRRSIEEFHVFNDQKQHKEKQNHNLLEEERGFNPRRYGYRGGNLVLQDLDDKPFRNGGQGMVSDTEILDKRHGKDAHRNRHVKTKITSELT